MTRVSAYWRLNWFEVYEWSAAKIEYLMMQLDEVDRIRELDSRRFKIDVAQLIVSGLGESAGLRREAFALEADLNRGPMEALPESLSRAALAAAAFDLVARLNRGEKPQWQ